MSRGKLGHKFYLQNLVVSNSIIHSLLYTIQNNFPFRLLKSHITKADGGRVRYTIMPIRAVCALQMCGLHLCLLCQKQLCTSSGLACVEVILIYVKDSFLMVGLREWWSINKINNIKTSELDEYFQHVQFWFCSMINLYNGLLMVTSHGFKNGCFTSHLHSNQHTEKHVYVRMQGSLTRSHQQLILLWSPSYPGVPANWGKASFCCCLLALVFRDPLPLQVEVSLSQQIDIEGSLFC